MFLPNSLILFQRRTGWAQEVVYRAEFSDLVSGQDYCALANFSFGPPTFPLASSPPSHPHCVHQAAPGPGERSEVKVMARVRVDPRCGH